MKFHIEGRAELIAELRKLGGPRLNRIARAATDVAMRPVLRDAAAQAPVSTGRLAASLGKLAAKSRRAGFVGTRVGVRLNFTYTPRQSESDEIVGEKKTKMVSGGGKFRDAKLAKGFTADKTAAQLYAGGIHFGTDKSGRVKRKAGPAPFLDNAIRGRAAQCIQTVAAELKRAVETQN